MEHFQMELLNKITKITKEYSTIQKPIFFISLIVGAIYLNTYLRGFGIPFPLDLSVLPTILLVIGFFSVLLTIIISMYLLLVAIINIDPWDTGFKRVINTNKTGLYAPHLKNYLIYALVSYILPFTLFLVIMINYGSDTTTKQLVLWFLYAIWAFICSFAWAIDSQLPKNERISFILKMSFHIFTVQVVSVVSVIILISIVLSKTPKISDMEFYIIIVVYLLINLACILPSFSTRKFKKIHNDDNKLSADDLINKSQLTPTYFVIAILIFVSLLPPFAFHIGEIPLRLMNIGGNLEFIATDARRQCDSWPEIIIDKKDEEKCQSKVGHLIIQLSDRAFAIFENKLGKPVLVSLNFSKSAIVSTLPEDSQYKVIHEKEKHKN